jgi:hypothetical protein
LGERINTLKENTLASKEAGRETSVQQQKCRLIPEEEETGKCDITADR